MPVQLGAARPLTVTMSDSLGRITGTVTRPVGAPITGATVTATDGKRTWPVTSSSASPGTAAGSYVIARLPAGAYTVTAPTAAARTTLVTDRGTVDGGLRRHRRPRPTGRLVRSFRAVG